MTPRFLLLVLLMPSLAAAQPLTLDRAVRDALVNNASLRGARAGAAENAAAESGARAGWFPRISLSENWQRGDEPVFVFGSLLSSRRFAAANFAIDALNHPDPINFFHASVGLEQIVFDGGYQRAVADEGRLRRQIADLAVDEAAAALIVDTTEAYGRVLTGDALRRAADAAVQATEEDLLRARQRRDAGLATDGDVLALVAHLADLRQRAIQYAGDADVARAMLNRLMGAPVERAFDVVEPARTMPDEADVQALLGEADRARPEIRQAAAGMERAAAESRRTRSTLIPQASAQAAVDVSGTRFGDRTSEWIVGGSLRWSFSLGGAELAGIRAAAHARTRAEAEADEARAAVHVDVVTAVRRLQAAAARQAAGAAAVDDARESERIVRDRFDAGLAGVTDVLRSSSAVLDAETQRISALVDVIVGEASLRRALGRQP